MKPILNNIWDIFCIKMYNPFEADGCIYKTRFYNSNDKNILLVRELPGRDLEYGF